ncbi:MAG TPA: 2-hydroxyacid dehydrogenase [Jatrophihabitantaceae bacterium]
MTTICLPDAAARERLGDLPAGVQAVVWDGSGPPPAGIEDVGFLVARYSAAAMTAGALARLPALRVIQLLSAGVEAWLDRVPDGVLLYNARGVHGGSTAELAVAGMLSVLRQLPRFGQAQLAHEWVQTDTDGLAGKRVLILGAGDIGSRIAAAVEVFDARVTFVGRRIRDRVHGLAEVSGLLPQHDIVVVAIPHTPETHHVVDATFLAAMPDNALFVNIARGPIVDTDALLAELAARRLHAFLDVTEPEPLPAGHPLWDAPNLVLTPHVGGGTYGWERRAYRLVREQVIRWHDGEPLENLVTDGY